MKKMLRFDVSVCRIGLVALLSGGFVACSEKALDPEGMSSSEGAESSAAISSSSYAIVVSSGADFLSSSAPIPLSSGADFSSSSPIPHSSGVDNSSSSQAQISSSVWVSAGSSSLISSSASVPQGTFVYAVNCGGAQVTHNTMVFQEDRFANGGTPHVVTGAITGSTAPALFLSERYGSYSYEIPVTNGTYNVHLHFAELYQTTAGARSFNVIIEGQPFLSEIDLFAEAGAFAALTQSKASVQVSDGFLTIELESLVDNATLSAFEIWTTSGGAFVEPPPPDPTTATKEDTGFDCTVGSPSGSNGGSSTVLPDPFTTWSGSRVTTAEGWRCRRREIVVEVQKRILGDKAPPPQNVTGSISRTNYSVTVQNAGASTSFSGTVSVPSTGTAPYPAVIVIGGFNSLNTDVLSSEGVATLSYDNGAIASEAANNFTTGKYYDVNPDQKGNTGALVAWAWGVSRIIDMLEKNPGVIDPTKIAVHGCSRLGKAAFVIGAFDERIALGLPLEPGTGGSAPLRALPSLGGQTLAGANGEASWFGPMSRNYAATMPVDMHDVAAMYAPRGLLLMDNPHIDHLSYKANYLGAAAARKVFDAMGRADALWYLGNSGNGSHCAVRTEYAAPLRAMIKKFLKNDGTATTGGLDRHSNHGTINVDSWTAGWKTGPIAR